MARSNFGCGQSIGARKKLRMGATLWRVGASFSPHPFVKLPNFQLSLLFAATCLAMPLLALWKMLRRCG